MTPKFSARLAGLVLAFCCLGQVYRGASAEPEVAAGAPANQAFITQTVYGFLDFTTTIANTVMVFSPQSAPPEGTSEPKATTSPSPAIETKPPAEKKRPDIQPSKTHKSAGTKKDTKIVVNSVIEQNVVNESNGDGEPAGKAVTTRVQVPTQSSVLSTVFEVRPKNNDAPGVKNNLAEPEYDFLSKQPAEVVDESYKVINILPSSKHGHAKPRPSARRDKDHPTGLVTKLGGTIVKDGLTTVHETNVIGTYINGKYAQVLQSSSRLLNQPQDGAGGGADANKIKPSGPQRILKTIGPQQHGKFKQAQQPQQQLEPTAPATAAAQTEEPLNEQTGLGGGRPGRRNSAGAIRPKFRNKIVDESEVGENGQQQNRQTGKNRSGGSGARPNYKVRSQQKEQKEQQQQQQQQSSTTAEPASGSRRRAAFRPSNSLTGNSPAKQYKSAKSEQPSPFASASAKSKLPHTQGRWSYKTTPKPRIQIRKPQADDEAKPSPAAFPGQPNEQQQQQQQPPPSSAPISAPSVQAAAPSHQDNKLGAESSQKLRPEGRDFDGELDESESEDVINVSGQQQQQQQPEQAGGPTPQPTERPLPIETINIEISTPADFNDVYYEIATMKSPYEFQVGSSRNTRYVTVTSTYKKTFATAEPASSISPSEPLTENILANTGAAYETSLPLDSSVATLPAIVLEPSQSTPPLETITETFSTTQTLLKTHLLPVIMNGNSTSRLTLVQTYNVARVVTATKTLPPAEIYQFVPSKTLNEFNTRLDEAGSELHLELDFSEDERDDEDAAKRVLLAPSSDPNSDLEPFKQTPAGATAPARANEGPIGQEQAQQLALLKLLGQQAQPAVITTSRPVVILETVYESHVIPLISAGSTILSTLSRPVGTVPRTSYEYGTSTLAPQPALQPALQAGPVVPGPALPFFPPAGGGQPAQFTVTSLPVVQQTLATVQDSRVLKLTFGAKTAYTTLYSPRLVPTELTTYVTSTIALQPTVPAYHPGYFPPPAVGFPGYPYVG